jgi:hypothetical protein
MTVQSDTAFVALGQEKDPPKRGFGTEATSLEYGVNVQGTRCGVYGESINVVVRDSDIPGVGVCGTGETVGVYGQGM